MSGGAGGLGSSIPGSHWLPGTVPDWVLDPHAAVRSTGVELAPWIWAAQHPTGSGLRCLCASGECVMCAFGMEMRCCCHLFNLESRGRGSLLGLSTQEPRGARRKQPRSSMVSAGTHREPGNDKTSALPQAVFARRATWARDRSERSQNAQAAAGRVLSDLHAPCAARAREPLCRLKGGLCPVNTGDNLLPALRRGFCPGTPGGGLLRIRGYPANPPPRGCL